MRELPMTKPRSTPTAIAMPKPAIVTQKVRHAWPVMIALNSQNCVQMRHGLGKMNSDTPKPEQMICHSTITATSSSQGDQRSICFLFFMLSCQLSLGDHGGRLCSRQGGASNRADVAAQFEHDVGEF